MANSFLQKCNCLHRGLNPSVGRYKWAVLGFLLAAVLLLIPRYNTAGIQSNTPAGGCEYWVAPDPEGSNGNPGTFAEPWATLEYASANVPDDGCTVWFKDGTYSGLNNPKERFTAMTTFKAVNPYLAILENDGLSIELDGVRNMLFEGFQLRHNGPVSGDYIVIMDRRDDIWSEYVIFRNNIFYDAYNNDLLKIRDGSRFVTVENNIFYNQGASDQHIDVNGVTDIVIQDNIFFNDFAGSGRSDDSDSKHFIVVKDSNDSSDGLEGAERITIQRNIFLNWEGYPETFVQIGNDGKPYHEAEMVWVVNNLLIGNSDKVANAAFGVRGAKDVTFANNTVVGDFPSEAYAFWINISGDNPLNQNIAFYNNIWADPTGTMGASGSGDSNEFATGNANVTTNLVLDNNLYWNGGEAIPPGDPISPTDDDRRLVADPELNTNQSGVVLPRWQGTEFLSGNTTIRQEFERLVDTYGRLPNSSPAIGQADPAFAPVDDILGNYRGIVADMGAFEYGTITLDERQYLPLIFKTTTGAGAGQADLFVSKTEGIAPDNVISVDCADQHSFSLSFLCVLRTLSSLFSQGYIFNVCRIW
ncbi:MAG: hypothetical protein DHS20C20_24970 [Ardenticatenaceae bacterium]|nr:MAG: hypothetical protein DHS20C20_24970 [Ardenticatenaceae bacterium]